MPPPDPQGPPGDSFEILAADSREEAAAIPPPRPTTPPLRRGFAWALVLLSMLTAAVYGVPYLIEQSGYAYEKGRARASTEALEKLDASGSLARASELFRLATQAVAPAVVHIRTQTFGKNGQGGGNVGSGVVIDRAKGQIVTNHHVVDGADLITVRVGKQTELVAELVGDDPKTDLAVIRVKVSLPLAAEWGDSTRLEPGDWVLAIGSPLGLERTVSAGIVSATARNNLGVVGQDTYEDFLQTDVAINPGNSGGPLVDLRGRVIGINTAISLVSPENGGGNQGIGFAISSNLARRVTDQLILRGKVVRGYLGVISQPMTPDQAKQLGSPGGKGALIGSVLPNSPAARAGLKVEDVILAIGPDEVADPSSLRNTTFTLGAGTVVPLRILRGRRTLEVPVAIAEMPGDPVIAYFGFGVKNVEPDPGGSVAVDQVVAGSPAEKAGLKVGQRILSIGRRRIFSKAEFDVAVAQFGGLGTVPLGILRDGKLEGLSIGPPGPEQP